MQNIIQMEDDIKGMPDQTLQMLARQPSSQVPQFLVVSEIQRRTDMRKRFEAQKQQPQGSVSDRIVDEGLASLAPPPQMQAPMPMQPQQMPQQMAAGGVVGMQAGRQAPFTYLSAPRRAGDATSRQRMLTPEGRAAIMPLYTGTTQLRESNRGGEFITPSKMREMRAAGLSEDDYQEMLEAEGGAGSGYRVDATGGLVKDAPTFEYQAFDPELAESFAGVEFESESFDPLGRTKEANLVRLARFAEQNPERFGQIQEGLQAGQTLREFLQAEDIARMGEAMRPGMEAMSYSGNPPTNRVDPMDLDQDGLGLSPDVDLSEVLSFSMPEIDEGDASKLASNAVKEDGTQSPLEAAVAQVAAARGKKADAEFNYQALIDRANTSAEQYTREAAERAEDLRKQSKKDMLSSALIELGAGIAAGDLAGGLSRAGRSAADIKQTASTQARAEEAEARRLAEAARQRGEGFSIEAFKSAQEQERYDQQLDIAAKEFAAKILSDEEDRGLRERLAGADRDAALERLAASFANDQSLLDQKQTEARRLFNEGKIQAGKEALGDAINKYINSASFQKRIEFMEPEEKEALIKSETQRIRDSVGDLYEYKPSVSFADRK